MEHRRFVTLMNICPYPEQN